MSNQLVKVAKHSDHVVLITMNRLERHHALNHELATRLVEALEDCENDPDVSAVVLTGAGEKAFCAGQIVRHLTVVLIVSNRNVS